MNSYEPDLTSTLGLLDQLEYFELKEVYGLGILIFVGYLVQAVHCSWHSLPCQVELADCQSLRRSGHIPEAVPELEFNCNWMNVWCSLCILCSYCVPIWTKVDGIGIKYIAYWMDLASIHGFRHWLGNGHQWTLVACLILQHSQRFTMTDVARRDALCVILFDAPRIASCNFDVLGTDPKKLTKKCRWSWCTWMWFHESHAWKGHGRVVTGGHGLVTAA